MRIDIMTLFPDFVDYILSESIIGRARKSGVIDIRTHNIRDYSENKHRRVDDTPYGGGKGMLMAAPPIYNCYQAILATYDSAELPEIAPAETPDFPEEAIEAPAEATASPAMPEEQGEPAAEAPKKPYVVYMSPRGRVLNQGIAKELSEKERLIVLCGHYEGVDERIIEEIVDEEISIGDYVLTGGEVPCCILVDCVARLCDGVLSDAECHEKESFSDDLLEYPQYTRPVDFMGRVVPEVLLSGHHANIDKWRKEKSLALTQARRPDLLEK